MAEPPNSNEPPSDAAGGKPPQHFSLRNRKQKEEPSTEELLANINRSLPFSDEAEKGVLSGILQDPAERLSESRVQIPLEAFCRSANRIVYETLQTFRPQHPARRHHADPRPTREAGHRQGGRPGRCHRALQLHPGQRAL